MSSKLDRMSQSNFSIEFMNMSTNEIFYFCFIIIYVFLFFLVVTGSVVVEDVTGLSGQEVSLPCDVDVEACGDFHSIKWFRESQRIFVLSELANLERSESFLTNRSACCYSSFDMFLSIENSPIPLDGCIVFSLSRKNSIQNFGMKLTSYDS